MSCYYGLPPFYNQYRESNFKATLRFLASPATMHYRRRTQPVGQLYTYIGKGPWLNADRVSVQCCAVLNPAMIGEMDEKEVERVRRQGKELEKRFESVIAV
ncbi:hypothetical protein IAR50_007550 [Cryptococcus sp. DSM 104548]